MSAKAPKLFTQDGKTYLGRIEVPGGPECGVDGCDSCGDCLVCDFCPHQAWIVYEDDLAQFLAAHDDAVVKWADG